MGSKLREFFFFDVCRKRSFKVILSFIIILVEDGHRGRFIIAKAVLKHGIYR